MKILIKSIIVITLLMFVSSGSYAKDKNKAGYKSKGKKVGEIYVPKKKKNNVTKIINKNEKKYNAKPKNTKAQEIENSILKHQEKIKKLNAKKPALEKQLKASKKQLKMLTDAEDASINYAELAKLLATDRILEKKLFEVNEEIKALQGKIIILLQKLRNLKQE